jgi:hypothetical protein
MPSDLLFFASSSWRKTSYQIGVAVSSKVFISHSNKDKPTADAICNHLESAGVRCRIAPRDILFGSDWTEGIMRGIDACKQITPLLERQQNEIDKGTQIVRRTLETAEKMADTSKRQSLLNLLNQAEINNESTKPVEREFHPQSIPFFAATEAFNYFRQAHPDYAYKEAALNPTNLRDRNVDWEADVVSIFRKNPDKTEFIGNRETPGGPSLFVSAPIRVDDKSCLECHSTPDKAPSEMVKLYGSVNGFGWKEGDVIGAQIVSMPAAVSDRIANSAFQSLLAWLIGIGALIFALVNFACFFLVPRAQTQTPTAESK